MSQYPSPYQPPPPQYGPVPSYPYPTPNPGAPARRAGILLFILAGLAIVGGAMCALMATSVAQMMATHPELIAQLPPEATPDLMRAGLFVVAALCLLYGILLILLGLFVRRNSKIAIVTAMILVILSLLFMGLNVLKGMTMGGSQAASGVCMCLLPALLSLLLLAWLAQALKNTGPARAAELYAAQYWQFAQQQAYQQQLWQQQQDQQQQQGGPPNG